MCPKIKGRKVLPSHLFSLRIHRVYSRSIFFLLIFWNISSLCNRFFFGKVKINQFKSIGKKWSWEIFKGKSYPLFPFLPYRPEIVRIDAFMFTLVESSITETITVIVTSIMTASISMINTSTTHLISVSSARIKPLLFTAESGIILTRVPCGE